MPAHGPASPRARDPALRGRRRRHGVFLDQGAGGFEHPDAGDRFGAALFRGFGLLAGAPGEDIAGRRDAGVVSEYRVHGDDSRSVSGRAHSGARTGATLGIAPDRRRPAAAAGPAAGDARLRRGARTAERAVTNVMPNS